MTLQERIQALKDGKVLRVFADFYYTKNGQGYIMAFYKYRHAASLINGDFVTADAELFDESLPCKIVEDNNAK